MDIMRRFSKKSKEKSLTVLMKTEK